METGKPLIIQLLEYTAKPVICESEKLPWYMVLANVFRLWALSFVLAIFFALIGNIFLKNAGYLDEDFKLVELITDFSPLLIFFLVVFWASITEEIGFRLWLRFSPAKWGLGLGFLVFFLITLINPSFIPEELFTFDTVWGFCTTLLLIGSVFFSVFFLLKNKRVGNCIESFFKRNFHFFFYSLAFFFAVMHITNYNVDLKNIWYFAPLLIFPQLLLSFVISFIRMKYGFIWAILTHALNNAVAIIPLLLFETVFGSEFVFLEGVDMIEELSGYELYLILIAGCLLFFIFFLCLLAILSLLLEFTKKRK